MKIIIYSSYFYPHIGGLESIMQGLAEGFSLQGHQITVFTKSPEEKHDDKKFIFKIIRKCSLISLVKFVKHADFFIEANISLKTAIVGLLYRKKWIVIHHGVFEKSWKGKLKNYLTNKVILNICVSNYVASHIKGPKVIVHNFYDSHLFLNLNSERTKDIVFLGRLVPDKGAEILIKAIDELVRGEKNISVTIIGYGPESKKLKNLAKKLGLANVIQFTGILTGGNLVKTLNNHKIMVVPSLCEDGFGLVALEGLACGCRLIVSNKGGLPEAIGKCGTVYNAQSVDELAGVIDNLLFGNEKPIDAFEIQTHLGEHNEKYIISKYLDALKTL